MADLCRVCPAGGLPSKEQEVVLWTWDQSGHPWDVADLLYVELKSPTLLEASGQH